MRKSLSLLAIGALLSTSVLAGDIKEIKQDFTLSANGSLNLDVPVGSIEMTVTDSDKVEVFIEIEPKSDGWFSGKTDLERVELEHEQNGNHLKLGIDNDDIKQTWHIKVPKSASLEVDLGVGNLEIDGLANDADIEVGVGSVRIDSALDDFDKIILDAGVGDTKLRGMKKEADEKRKMVSSETHYRGNGNYKINVEVGVGDIKVTH